MDKDPSVKPQIQQIAIERGLEVEFADGRSMSFAIRTRQQERRNPREIAMGTQSFISEIKPSTEQLEPISNITHIKPHGVRKHNHQAGQNGVGLKSMVILTNNNGGFLRRLSTSVSIQLTR